jgi:MtaA/CmuA family methyltransferase
MTPYERVFNRLKGEKVDRIPNLNIIMLFAAKFIDVPYGKYVTDYRYLVKANIKCCERFGIDMLSAISDPMREAADFGAKVTIPEDGVPYSYDYLIKDYDDLKKLKTRSPLSPGRMLDRIKAIERYKQEAGKEYPILGWVEGGFAESTNLRGMNNIMIDLFDNPGFVRELMEICTGQAILFACEQVKAGADFIGVGDAAASLVGPDIYREFILPYQKRLVEAIHAEGAKVKLHICGNISGILDIIPLSGADMVDIDWMVDFGDAVKRLEGKSSACGNFDPVSVLLEGSVGDVKRAVRKCVSQGNSTTFIAAGCEVPKFTPYENMQAVAEVLMEVF